MHNKCRECKKPFGKRSKRIFCNNKCYGLNEFKKNSGLKIATLYKTGKYSMSDLADRFKVSYQYISHALETADRHKLINKEDVVNSRMCVLGVHMYKSKQTRNRYNFDYMSRYKEILQLRKTMTFRKLGDHYGISATAARNLYYKAMFKKITKKL